MTHDPTPDPATDDTIAVLRAELTELRREVASLRSTDDEAHRDSMPAPTSRRQMFRAAGASAVGLVVGSQLVGSPVAAAGVDPVEKNDTNLVTDTTVLDGTVDDGPIFTAFNRSTDPRTNAIYGESRAIAPAIRGENRETGGLGGIGVGGIAPGGRDLYAFGSGRIAMNDHAFDLAANEYSQGEIHQAGGTLYLMIDKTERRELAGPASAGALHPVAPTRVYDSREPAPSPGRLAAGSDREISVADGRAVAGGGVIVNDLVPAGATAIAYNLTVTQTADGGFLNVTPGQLGGLGASAINWTESNATIANASFVGVSPDRTIRVSCGAGSTHFLVDVVGYYA